MQFSCKDADEKIEIFLPCPGGITFADSGSYGTINAGSIGAMAGAAAAKAVNRLGDGASVGEVAKTGINAAIDGAADAVLGASAEGLSKDAALALAMKTGGDFGEGVSFESKVIMDPRVNTTFTGNGMRSFSFEFKMIATSPEESQTVKNIYNAFRRNIYASKTAGSLIALSYPPLWEVKFLDGDKLEMEYIPKIDRCYLTSVNTVFNGENNSWRVDTAPLSVNISISFQEHKVLVKDDIARLERETPDRVGAGDVGSLNSLQSGFKKSVNKKLDSLKNEITDIFKF